MTPKCYCGLCYRDVPSQVDGTPKRHANVWCGMPRFEMDPCPGGSNLYPILMSGPMATAIAAGVKGSTLRESPKWEKARKGDRAYVKETWALSKPWTPGAPIVYRAGPVKPEQWGVVREGEWCPGEWSSSRFAPYRASRFILRLTEDPHQIRPQELTLDQIMMEGVKVLAHPGLVLPQGGRKWWKSARFHAAEGQWSSAFGCLWIAINGEKSWDENKPVWRLVFDVEGEAVTPAELGHLLPGDLDLLRAWLFTTPYPNDPTTRAAFERLMDRRPAPEPVEVL